MKSFQSKKILITGGSSGIGLEGAKKIVERGGEVIITGRNENKLNNAVKLLGGKNVIAVQNDSSSESTGIDLLNDIKKHMGDFDLDGAWFNAGILIPTFDMDVRVDVLNETFFTNVRGPVLQLAALLNYIKNGASVLFTSSGSSYDGNKTGALYAGSKGAINSISRCFATRLSDRKIRVNTLIPGISKTDILHNVDQINDLDNELTSKILLNRVSTPDEIANVGVFLLSDEASYVSGSEYVVDGGLLLR